MYIRETNSSTKVGRMYFENTNSSTNSPEMQMRFDLRSKKVVVEALFMN